jgi:hypothetical protein
MRVLDFGAEVHRIVVEVHFTWIRDSKYLNLVGDDITIVQDQFINLDIIQILAEIDFFIANKIASHYFDFIRCKF